MLGGVGDALSGESEVGGCAGLLSFADVVGFELVGRNLILLNSQSIDGLKRESQLYPKTTEQEGSRFVTKQVTVIVSPEEKRNGKSTEAEIREVEEPSKSWRGIGGIGDVGSLCTTLKLLSTKQCVEPESTKARKGTEDGETRGEKSSTTKEFGDERAEALSFTRVAQPRSTQSSACAEFGGLLTIFLARLLSQRVL